MAFETLNILDRIWRAQGLNTILLPCDLRLEPEKDGSRIKNGKIEEINGRVHDSFQAKSGNEVPPAASGRSPGETQPERFTPLPVSQWPEIWQTQLKDTRKARLAWSYWNLGPDLLAIRGARSETEEQQVQRKERLGFMRSLLKDIGLPPATHTFWPTHLDDAADPIAQPGLFWSGLCVMGCRGVVLMGSSVARAVLRESRLAPLTHLRENGMLIWIIWDIDSFGRDPGNYRRMVTYLRKALSPLAPKP